MVQEDWLKRIKTKFIGVGEGLKTTQHWRLIFSCCCSRALLRASVVRADCPDESPRVKVLPKCSRMSGSSLNVVHNTPHQWFSTGWSLKTHIFFFPSTQIYPTALKFIPQKKRVKQCNNTECLHPVTIII